MYVSCSVCVCVCVEQSHDLVFLHKVDVGRPLDLHGLTLTVVQRQHEVEEVGLPQVGGRLLLKVSSGQTHTAATHTHTHKQTGRSVSSLKHGSSSYSGCLRIYCCSW